LENPRAALKAILLRAEKSHQEAAEGVCRRGQERLAPQGIENTHGGRQVLSEECTWEYAKADSVVFKLPWTIIRLLGLHSG